MGVIAVAIKHLISAGVTGDELVMVVTEMEDAITPKRSAAAERQARYRERIKASRDATGDEKKEIPPTPPKEKNINITTHAREAAPDFLEFWSSYPHPAHRGSKAKAMERFQKLSKPDRDAVLASLRPYRDYCDVADWYSPKMAEGYLNHRKRLWENPPNADQERNRNTKTDRECSGIEQFIRNGQVREASVHPTGREPDYDLERLEDRRTGSVA